MSNQQKINELQKLEKEIKDIKSFMSILEMEDTTHVSQHQANSFVSKQTNTLYFKGLWKNGREISLRIPEKIRISISHECEDWIKCLQQRFDEHLKNS